MFVATLGHGHPLVADIKRNKALVHKKRGEKDLAKQLLLECEAICAKVYGADHSKTAEAAREARACA